MINLEFLQTITSFLPLLTFLSPIMGGGFFVIILSSIYSTDFSNLFLIYLFSVLGFSFFDFMLFLVGRNSNKIKFFQRKFFIKMGKKANKFYEDRLKPNYFTTLFSSKLLYGLGATTLIFIGRKEKSQKRFLLFDFLTNLLLILIFVLVGCAIGKGFRMITELYENKLFVFLFFLVLIILIFFLEKFIRFLIRKK